MPDPKWTFPARFRARAFGWKGTKLAKQRLREAVREIKAVRRSDPLLAAEGAVLLLGRIVPAIEEIDGSSGAIGTAVSKTVDALIDLLASTEADLDTRAAWLDRAWEAWQEDGYGYLDRVPDRFGELCASPVLAGRWADRLAPTLRRAWTDRGRMRGDSAALSCLLAAGRPAEVIELLELAPFPFWNNQRFAVQALVELGRPEEAIRYAETRSAPGDRAGVAQACERILLDLGRSDEAYDRYAMEAHRARTYLATYRSLARAYPHVSPDQLLSDLVASTPGEEGKWFATAKDLGLYDVAIELANRTACDPKTLLRAARDFEASEPLFALKAALTALRWLVDGWGYDLDGTEVHRAFRHAMAAADRVDQRAGALQAMDGLVEPPAPGESATRAALRRKVQAARAGRPS